MRLYTLALACVCAVAFSGCATITSSEIQQLAISTQSDRGENVEKAKCTARNDKGVWEVQTPAFAPVQRSAEDLIVECTKQGFPVGTLRAISRAHGGMWGNIIFGGGVGAIIDHTKGTGYSYPDTLAVTLGASVVFDRRDQMPGSPIAAAAPAGAPEFAAAPGAAGDVWTYRLTMPGRPGAPIEVVMTSVGAEEIAEQFFADDGSQRRAVHRKGAYLEPFGALSHFSPYFPAFEKLHAGASIRNIEDRDPRTCGPAWTCSVRGRVMGRERLRLPAGDFEAIRVDIEQTWMTPPNTPSGFENGARTLRIWYSPELKRALKFSSRGPLSRYIDTTFDLELASYRPSAPGAVKPN